MSHNLSAFLKYLSKSNKAFVYLKTVAIVQILLKSPRLMSTKGKATAPIKYKIKGSRF